MATMDHLIDTILALDTESVRASHRVCAASVETARRHGEARIADWYDALGAVLGLELQRRAGELDPATLTYPGPGVLLLERTRALRDDELYANGMSFLHHLSGMGICPRGNFLHAALGILETEGLSRQILH